MNFGEKLFSLRKEKGLAQEALAEQLNTSRQAVSKWENQQGYPETEKLLMLANLFEVSVDYLLKESPSDISSDGPRIVCQPGAGGRLSSVQPASGPFDRIGVLFLDFGRHSLYAAPGSNRLAASRHGVVLVHRHRRICPDRFFRKSGI